MAWNALSPSLRILHMSMFMDRSSALGVRTSFGQIALKVARMLPRTSAPWRSKAKLHLTPEASWSALQPRILCVFFVWCQQSSHDLSLASSVSRQPPCHVIHTLLPYVPPILTSTPTPTPPYLPQHGCDIFAREYPPSIDIQ